MFSGRGASQHRCHRAHTTVAETKALHFSMIKITCFPSPASADPPLPKQVSSRCRQQGIGEREEVKSHSWTGKKRQGLKGKLTRWHGMWCRAVKGAGMASVWEGGGGVRLSPRGESTSAPSPPPPCNTPVINGTQEVAGPMCHSR